MVNFYSGEGSSKPVLINAEMTALDICHKLVEKNHAMPDKNWAIIERISKFNLGTRRFWKFTDWAHLLQCRLC